ncbi:hypothetical protein ACQW02_09045 [Humitalea sp. 24SJ18S-53]|uniref:hypothetical protein n=1 Tax=Humitalea sp. 24SJ18S-53 TaxID=3422307 RepID=UPI003D66BAE8
MTMNLRDILGLKPKAETAAALRDALEQMTVQRDAALARLASLRAERGAVLLDASREAAEHHETELRAVAEEAERLSAMAAAMPERIAAASARELCADLDTAAMEAEARAEAGAALVGPIEEAVATLARLVAEHDEHNEAVQTINRKMREHGRSKITLPLHRIWPRAEVSNLGRHLALPGPRSPSPTLDVFQAEVIRARIPRDAV